MESILAVKVHSFLFDFYPRSSRKSIDVSFSELIAIQMCVIESNKVEEKVSWK